MLLIYSHKKAKLQQWINYWEHTDTQYEARPWHSRAHPPITLMSWQPASSWHKNIYVQH